MGHRASHPCRCVSAVSTPLDAPYSQSKTTLPHAEFLLRWSQIGFARVDGERRPHFPRERQPVRIQGPQDEPREIGQRIRRDGFADLKLFRSAGTIFFAPSPVESEDLSCVNFVSRCVLPSVGPAVVAGWHFECLHELRWGRCG